jgi:serine/threonine protein kinase
VSGHPEIAAGSILDQRYRIDELVSVGGMGAVYAGTHLLLHKRVAIKVLRSELPGAHLMVDRFQREAIAASAIGHENIVQVTDMGIVADGTAYIVMELLEGRDLGDAIKDEAPLAIGRACRICCEILRGLAAAHKAGIIHRDLKPDNVFLAHKRSREVIKIVDFGVSLLKRRDMPDTRLTSTGVLVGTPRYMSPEQTRGEQDLTDAVDIYAAGVVLYQMLTGEMPYVGEHYNVVVHEILAGRWQPIESRRPDVPPEIAAVIRRAMALAPAHRFATAEEMADALEPFADPTPTDEAGSSAASAGRSMRSEQERRSAALAGTEAIQLPAASTSRRVVLPPTSGPVVKDPAWAESKKPTVATPSPWRDSRMGQRPARGALLGFIAVLLVAGTAYLVLKAKDREPGGDVPRVNAPPPASRAESAPPAAAVPDAAVEESDDVTIDFAVLPESATVTVDGKLVEDRQLILTRGIAPVRIMIEAPDHEGRTLDVVPDQDQTIAVELVRAPESEPPRPPRPEPARPRPGSGERAPPEEEASDEILRGDEVDQPPDEPDQPPVEPDEPDDAKDDPE